MAEVFRSPEDKAIWEDRRRLVLDMLHAGVSDLASRGATSSEGNGWVFRAAFGPLMTDVSLCKPVYGTLKPETLILTERAFRMEGFRYGKPSRREVDLVFETGTAVLSDRGRAAAEDAVSWLVTCLETGNLPPAVVKPKLARVKWRSPAVAETVS